MNSGPMASTTVWDRIRSISIHCRRVDMPTRQARERFQLIRSPRTPKGEHRRLPVKHPAQRKVDDAPAIIFLREAVESFNRLQILRKPRRLELRVALFAGRPRRIASAPTCGQTAVPGTTGRRQVSQCSFSRQ